MGKTKIRTIDDSAQAEEKKKKASSKKVAKSSAAEAKPSVILEGAERPIESEKKDAIGPITSDLQHDKAKKPQKPGKTKPRSKHYQEVTKDLDRTKTYPIDEAVDMVKKMSYAKFNATLEAHINTAQTGIRGFLSLPYASGKKLRILVFGRLPSPEEYEGIVFGGDSTIEEISKGLPAGRQGKLDFDLVITTPQWMPKLAKVAKVLGPKGLMPNPKNGTITEDLKKAVESFQSGKTEYKTEPKAPVIHLSLGKLNQPTEELTANVKTLLSTLGKTRIKQVRLAPTMGPAVKLDLSTL